MSHGDIDAEQEQSDTYRPEQDLGISLSDLEYMTMVLQSQTTNNEIQHVHPSPQLPQVHDAAPTLVESKMSEDIDDNMPIVSL